MNNGRPKTFAEFIGKQTIKARLTTLIEACTKKKGPFPHTLFYGPAGVGKTTLAGIIANTLGVKLRVLQGTNVEKTADLLNVLSLINKHDVLFIDEIHALDKRVMEFLFPAIEDFVIDVVLGKEFNSKLTRMKLPPFTLIGATTELGRIVGPLEERFGNVVHLDYYTQTEIGTIIERRIQQTSKIKLSAAEINLIAQNSRYVPRNALRLTDRIIDYRIVNEKMQIPEIMTALDIKAGGISSLDLQYLNELAKRAGTRDGILGIKALSLITGIDPLTIETKIEPFLLKMNFIEKTYRGRKITPNGTAYLKQLNN